MTEARAILAPHDAKATGLRERAEVESNERTLKLLERRDKAFSTAVSRALLAAQRQRTAMARWRLKWDRRWGWTA